MGTMAAAASVLSPETEEMQRLFLIDEVSPLVVYSEKELSRTCEELGKMLNNKSHDHWQKRCDALRSIRALVMGGAAEYDGFMQCLQSLKLPLADAIADLRSTLVREACATAALLSQNLGKGFAQIAEVLIPPLLKQIPVTIAAISEPSNLSLRAIFRCTHHARLLPLILSSIGKNKSAVLRTRCIECVQVVVQTWAWQDVEKHSARLDEVVVQSLTDAQPDVRAGARRCVVALCQAYPQRGDRILRGLDVATQKKIFEETESGARSVDRKNASGRLKHPSLSIPLANQSDSKSPTWAGVGSSGSSTSAKMPSSNEGSGRYLGAVLARSRSDEGSKTCDDRLRPVSAAPQRQQPAQTQPVDRPATTLGAARRVSSKGQQGAAADVGAIGGDSKAREFRELDADDSRRLGEEDLVQLIAKCSNNLWSLRESSLVELTAQVQVTPPSRALLAVAPRVVEVAAERVSDAHYKVQQAGMSLLAAVASHLTACLSPNVDTVLRQILPRLVDKKEGSRKACVALLDQLYHSCGPQVLVASVNKAMEGVSAAVKVATLEYLTADVRLLAPLLAASPAQARSLMGHALPLCGDKVLEVRRGACAVTVQLRALAPLALYESLSKSWSPTLLVAVKKGLVTAGVVNLERELASFLRTKKLDPSVAEEANTLLAAALRKPRAMVPGADQEPSLSSRRHAASMHGTNHDEEAVRTCDRQVWHLHQDTVAPKYSASVYDDGDSEIVVSGRVERRGDLDLHLSSPHNPRAEEDVARGAPMEGDHDGELELEEAIEYTSSVRRQWEGRGELDRRKGWPEVRSEQLLKSPAPNACKPSSVAEMTPPTQGYNAARDGEGGRWNAQGGSQEVGGHVIEEWADNRHGQRPIGRMKGVLKCGSHDELQSSSVVAHPEAVVAATDYVRELSRVLGAVSTALASRQPLSALDSLAELLEFSRQVPKHLWEGGEASAGGEGLLTQWLVVVAQVTKSKEEEVVDAGLELLAWLVAERAEACEELSHIVVEALLQSLCCHSVPPSRATATKVEQLIGSLLSSTHPDRALTMVSRAVAESRTPALQVAVKQCGKLAMKCQPGLVALHLEELLPPLFKSFAHPHADVRKAVVFCVVDLYKVLGEDLMPYLDDGLSNSQLKLVTIYINKLQK